MIAFLSLLLTAYSLNVQTGTRIQLQSCITNRWVRVDQTQGNALIDDPALPWILGSTFQVTITSDGKWQLKSMIGQWVTAEGGGGQGVYANRQSASGWESFVPVILNGNQVQLQSNNGQWVGLSNTNVGSALVAKAATPSGWETFNVVIVPAVRGLNLGSWFIPESWMTDFYSGTGTNDLCSLCAKDRNSADTKMQNNLKTWITESDISWAASQGVNMLRLPIGYWNVISDPYKLYVPINVSISLSFIDQALQWAGKYGMKVLIDLHGAPGSQNGADHSGCGNGVVGWDTPTNIQYSLQAITAIAQRYGNNPNLYGIELLNEPAYSLEQNHHSDLLSYYEQAYNIIRQYDNHTAVVFNELYGDFYYTWNGQLTEPKYYNVMEDWHLYDCYGSQSSVSTQQHIIDAQNWGPMILQYQNQHPIFVGEWSLATGENPGGQAYANAEETSFANGYGWFFWSVKLAPDKFSCEWSFQNAVSSSCGYKL